MIEFPTTTVAVERFVVIEGVAFWTVKGSHGDVAGLLLESPE